MNVLNHSEASWGMGDFDFDNLVPQSHPLSLQPVHEPQTGLPLMAPPWYSDIHYFEPVNPAFVPSYGVSSYYNYYAYQEPGYTNGWDNNWPPSAQMLPLRSHRLAQVTLPAPGPSHEFSRRSNTIYNPGTSLQSYPLRDHMYHSQPRDSWKRLDFDAFYTTDAPRPPSHDAQPSANNQFQSSVVSNGASSTRLRLPSKEPSLKACPLVSGHPFAVPVGRPAIDMPLLPTNRGYRGAVTGFKTISNPKEGAAELFHCQASSSGVVAHDEEAAAPRNSPAHATATRSGSGESPSTDSSTANRFMTQAKVKKLFVKS